MSRLYDIEKFISGDKRTFELIYKTYVGKVYNYISSFISDSEMAKDITQNTFFQLWNSRTHLNPDINPDGYIYTIAKNLLLKEIRRQKVFNDYVNQVVFTSDEEDDSDVVEMMSHAAIEKRIHSLLVELPEARRRIFVMRWIKGLSNKEIAQKLEISEKTVSTQVHRVVGFLKQRLGSILVFAAIAGNILFDIF